jgi:AcrR family transcriptional regulator
VARLRPADRFSQLHAAALAVFAAKGLRRARMADVAREMGVAAGSLYNWVESKEALFHWLIEVGVAPGPVPEPSVLPIPTPPPGATEARLREVLAEGLRYPSLEAALTRRRVGDARAELTEIVGEFYDRLAGMRGPAAALERSAIDQPELYAVYFRDARRALFAKLTRYVEKRVRSGHFAEVGDVTVAARFIVETVAWFAWHGRDDPDPELLPDDETVRAEVLRRIVSSFVPE